MTRRAHYSSPIGPIVLSFDDAALTGLRFASPADGSNGGSIADHFPLTACIRWLDLYFSGRQPDFTPPIDLRGTAFQQRVWHELLTIPYGQTVTYGEIARRVGCRSAQAVGGAVGRNPIALIVPCHRVIGSDGTLTGYAFGLRRKQYLLQLEQSN
ncbi:MAG: methylated-DNA--[Bacteroidales bacterium]|nr:methylated-DNA--[protein]-cysteine S-methyltransferase [Bacteroidales bacterium]